MTKSIAVAAAVSLLALGAFSPAATAQQAGEGAAAAPAAQAPSPAAGTQAANGQVDAVIAADPQLSTFAKLAEKAGFNTTFSGAGPLTVFVPTNAAFAKLDPAQIEAWQKRENVEALQQVLFYHIVPADVPTSTLDGTKGEIPTARADAKLVIDGTGDALVVNGATVVRPDVTASNGRIHVVDAVLFPAAAAPAPAPAAPAEAPAAESAPPQE